VPKTFLVLAALLDDKGDVCGPLLAVTHFGFPSCLRLRAATGLGRLPMKPGRCLQGLAKSLATFWEVACTHGVPGGTKTVGVPL
jgi:hypothetical protein